MPLPRSFADPPADPEEDDQQYAAPEPDDETPPKPPFDSMGAYLTRLRDLVKGKVKDGLDDTAWAECVRRARGHAGGKAKAARRTDEPQPGTPSLWIGLYIPPESASAIALDIPEAEPPETLHLTLCYFGLLADLPDDAVTRAETAVAAFAFAEPPIELCLYGIARFSAEDSNSDHDCLYASLDDTEHTLAMFRDRLALALGNVGLVPKSDYGAWCPHVTLAYISPGHDPGPLPIPYEEATVSQICVSTTPAQKHEFTLAGQNAYPNAVAPTSTVYVELAEYVEPPDWVGYLPAPGSYKHPVYGSVDLPKDRITRFVDQFNRAVYQDRLPLDAEHETKLSGAVGWIVGMRQNQDGSADARVEWTDRGAQMLREDRFRYVSPEWYDEWTDPATGSKLRDVAIGGAITTRPFFKPGSLRPIAATEDVAASAREEPPMPEPNAAQTQTETPPDVLARRMTEMESELATLRSAREADQVVITAQESQIRSAAEQLQAIEATSRRRRFADEIEGRTQRSPRRWFGETDEHVDVLETLAATFGEDSEQVTRYVASQTGVAEAMYSSGIFDASGSSRRERGTSGSASADTRLTAMAQGLVEQGRYKTLSEAMDASIREHPELYEEHRQRSFVGIDRNGR